jgi:hypothetical protein
MTAMPAIVRPVIDRRTSNGGQPATIINIFVKSETWHERCLRHPRPAKRGLRIARTTTASPLRAFPALLLFFFHFFFASCCEWLGLANLGFLRVPFFLRRRFDSLLTFFQWASSDQLVTGGAGGR